MPADPNFAALEMLLEQHRADADGGDRLVREVIRHSRGLMPPEREELQRHLLDLVDQERVGVWPMALEVVVRTGTPEIGRALVRMLGAEERSAEWSDAVVLAMLRLGCSNAFEMCRDYLREELRLQHFGALPMLSWMYRTDLAYALELGARFYADTLGSGRPVLSPEMHSELARHLPGQLDGLLANSTGWVLDLIDRTAAHDRTAGRALAVMIRQYLVSADSRSGVGSRAVDALGDAIALRAG